MNFLTSPHVSLFCAVLNAVFAFQAMASGSWLFCGVCSFFAVFCFRNFLKAKK